MRIYALPHPLPQIPFRKKKFQTLSPLPEIKNLKSDSYFLRSLERKLIIIIKVLFLLLPPNFKIIFISLPRKKEGGREQECSSIELKLLSRMQSFGKPFLRFCCCC